MRTRTLLTMLFAGAFTIAPGFSYADALRDTFDFYKRNPGGVYTTDGMQGWVGPSFSARNNMTNPRLLTVRAPSFSAGCGGIDFFAGSFSIITKDEIVQMARGIAQGAPGYFFNLAIDAVCPSCGNNMRELQRKLESFNELTQNACETAWEAFDSATDLRTKASEGAKSLGVQVDVADGFTDDWGQWLSKPGDKDGYSENMNKAVQGNTTVDAAVKNIEENPAASALVDIKQHELFASIFGSTIIAPNPIAGDPPVIIPVKPTIVFEDMLENPIDRITVQKCVDPDPAACFDMVQAEIAFEGLIKRNLRLITSEDPANPGILYAIRKNVTMGTDSEELYLNTRYPYQETVRKYAEYPGIFDTVGELLAIEVSKAQLTTFYTEHRNRILDLTITASDLPQMQRPDDYKKSVEAADIKFADAMMKLEDRIASIRSHYAIHANLQQLIK